MILLLTTACSTALEPQDESGVDLASVSPDEIPDRDEVHHLMAECLRDKGWSATVREGPGGGVHIDVATEEHRRAAQEALEACNEDLVASGVVPHPERPPSEEMIKDMFESDLELHACLTANGYAVPDVPSFDVYMDGVLAGHGESRWDPMSELYATAGASTAGHLDDAFDDCLEEH